MRVNKPGGMCFLFLLISLFFILISFVFKFPYLYEWDSVNYIKATEEFNLFLNQPQPPGYIGFVFILKLFVSLFKNNFYGFYFFVLISYILYAFVSTLLFKEFNRNSFDLAIYTLFLSTPMIFFHSMVTTIYMTEGATVVCLVYILLKIFKHRLHPIFIFAILLGGFIKTNIPVVLLPLAVYVIWIRFEKRGIKFIFISALVLMEIAGYLGLKKMVFHFSQAPDILDQLISGYIMNDNILSAYFGGFKNLMVSIIKNFKNVVMALLIQIIPIFLLLIPRGGKISIFKNLDPKNRNFLMIWIIPHLIFVLFFYFPKNGYLLEIFSGILILVVIGCFSPEVRKIRLKWVWIINLVIFFLPLNLDYIKAKVRISGQDKNSREYLLSQVVRVFETTFTHLKSVEKVNDYYFSEIRNIKSEGSKLFILDNMVADHRIIPYYLKDMSFLIVQKEKKHFIVSFFHNEKTQVKLINRNNPQLTLQGYNHHYLVSSTPSKYKENIVEMKNTIYKIVDNSIKIKGLKMKFSSNQVLE